MTEAAPLAPEELAPVSALVAATLARLYDAHPELMKHAVGMAYLGITSRYELVLRGRPDLGPVMLGAEEVRRELMYFENTRRPLVVEPTLTAVDLAADARAAICSRGAREAFDHAVALLVRCARRAAQGRRP
jgi:hypothetical protein